MTGFQVLGDGGLTGAGTIDYFDAQHRHRDSVFETAEATDINGRPMGITWNQTNTQSRLAFDAGTNQIYCRQEENA